MNEFWNNRYSTGEYAYGTLPGEFLKSEVEKLNPDKILFPAEGEGRNAAYAACLDWQVFAFDISIEAKQKADKLAGQNKVNIHYTLSSVEEIIYPDAFFDCFFFIFEHFPPQICNRHHRKVLRFLRPGGTIILEGLSKKQIIMDSCGPKDPSRLFSRKELKNDFDSLSACLISETNYIRDEGKYHQGPAAVIRLTGKK